MTKIGHQYGVTAQAITYWMNKYELEHRSQVLEVAFEASPAMSYILGCLHGDAFIHQDPKYYRNTIQMSVIDRPFAEALGRALKAIGLNINIVDVKARENGKAQFKVYAHSKMLIDEWNSLDAAGRLKLGMTYPRDFTRGVYDSEGSVNLHRGTLELTICSTNEAMIDLIIEYISHLNFHPKRYVRLLPSGKNFYSINLYRSLEVKKFMAWIMPTIKIRPRSEDMSIPSRAKMGTS